MEFFGYLAPVAFIFALAALARVNALEKEVKELKKIDQSTKSGL